MPKTLMIAAVLVGSLFDTSAQAAKRERPRRTAELPPSVTVIGTGEVNARPDMAQITVGVLTEAKTAAEAMQSNNTAMEKLIDLLKQQGLEEKDIQTTNFSVSPQYRQDQPRQAHEPPRIVGYQVSNLVQIKVRKLAGLGGILDEVVTAGANQVHGISFSIAETEELLDDARQKAMESALRKAQLYARAAGMNVGKALLIQEATPNVPRPVSAGVRMAMAQSAVPIASGEQSLSASVTVTYELVSAE